ncbi:unnamed protein product, partial [Arabidopsis halleri]
HYFRRLVWSRKREFYFLRDVAQTTKSAKGSMGRLRPEMRTKFVSPLGEDF